MASSLYRAPSLGGHRDALNELAKGQIEVSAKLRSLLRLSPESEASSQPEADQAGHPKKRKASHSSTITSCAPYDDGFQWRKYGEKKISKSKFTRSYFRCAYRDEQGCMATKHVQQKEMEDPPLFMVTYSVEHTCNCLSSLFITEHTTPGAVGSLNFQASEHHPHEKSFEYNINADMVLDDRFGEW